MVALESQEKSLSDDDFDTVDDIDDSDGTNNLSEQAISSANMDQGNVTLSSNRI